MDKENELYAFTSTLKGSTSRQQSQYDLWAKKLLGNKLLLSHIFKAVIPEYRGVPLEIIGESIGDTKINTHSTNAYARGNYCSEESQIPDEGIVYFDVVVQVQTVVDGQKPIIFIANLEAQRDWHPGYDLVPRSFYYCSRLISEQKLLSFKNSDYDKIQKVYSIWICMPGDNVSEEESNTIDLYSLGKTSLTEKVYNGTGRFDLINAIFIRLGNRETTQNPILNILSTIFDDNLSCDEKIDGLEHLNFFSKEDIFQLEGEVFKEGLKNMCNLSEGIANSNLSRGIKIGKIVGRMTESIDKISIRLNKGITENQLLEDGYSEDEISTTKDYIEKGGPIPPTEETVEAYLNNKKEEN